MPAEEPNLPSTSAMMLVFLATFSFDEAAIPTGSVTPPTISTARFTEPENKIPFGVSPKDIFPLPQGKKITELQRRRQCQKSEIITSSPFKNNLIEKAEKKKVPMKKCNDKKQKTKGPMKKRCHETLKNGKVVFPQPPRKNSLPEETIPCRICDESYETVEVMAEMESNESLNVVDNMSIEVQEDKKIKCKNFSIESILSTDKEFENNENSGNKKDLNESDNCVNNFQKASGSVNKRIFAEENEVEFVEEKINNSNLQECAISSDSKYNKFCNVLRTFLSIFYMNIVFLIYILKLFYPQYHYIFKSSNGSFIYIS
ncbi:hypothetical protein FQA39_LY08879 [Lamprigera yunnana]|nr:hypothetical protein FQA39_LY08879 [Lamprigera yunnana]